MVEQRNRSQDGTVTSATDATVGQTQDALQGQDTNTSVPEDSASSQETQTTVPANWREALSGVDAREVISHLGNQGVLTFDNLRSDRNVMGHLGSEIQNRASELSQRQMKDAQVELRRQQEQNELAKLRATDTDAFAEKHRELEERDKVLVRKQQELNQVENGVYERVNSALTDFVQHVPENIRSKLQNKDYSQSGDYASGMSEWVSDVGREWGTHTSETEARVRNELETAIEEKIKAELKRVAPDLKASQEAEIINSTVGREDSIITDSSNNSTSTGIGSANADLTNDRLFEMEQNMSPTEFRQFLRDNMSDIDQLYKAGKIGPIAP